MGDQIAWQVALAVKPGQLDNFEKLTREMIEFTRGETGVLSYQRFVTDDGRYVQVYERYPDSAAAVAHFERALGAERLGSQAVEHGIETRARIAVHDARQVG